MPEEDESSEKETAAKTRGKIIHRLLLGKGADVVVCNVDAFRSNAAKAMRDEAIAAGKVPIIARKYDEMVAAAETIKCNLMTEFGIDLGAPGGESEVAIEWYEDGVHGPVLCRCRMDRVHLDTGLILDVKSIHSADPETCGKQAVEYGRDIQDAAYRSALERLRPELSGRTQMLFLHVEIDPPYAVYPGPLDGELRELGRQRWERAVFLWEDCVKFNRWPSYTNQVTPIRAPGYAMTKWMERTQDW
jgi:hypothetical protein